MAEKVIGKNQSIAPFFGERLSFIRGLDPLGLQNTSDSTFTMLLPGLNNVTGRIRYYSFYCWILDEYSKQNGSTDPDEQKVFIRRAEYIIALASQYFEGDASGIPGSNYASKEVYFNKKTVHDLQEGTYKPDGTTAETYWNYSYGAFGQYYLGSLRDIGLVDNRDQVGSVYYRTNSMSESVISGERLAVAFDENISVQSKDLFFNCIEQGIITEEQLKALLPEFNLVKVPNNSKEHLLLCQIILQKDFPSRVEEDPSSYRKETLGHLLTYLKSHEGEFNDRVFVYHAYDQKGIVNGASNKSLMGWYYYQFNEFWHFSNTSIFNGALAYLEAVTGPNWYSLSDLLVELTNGIIKEYVDVGLIESGETTVESMMTSIEPNEYAYLKLTSESNGVTKASNAFLLMFSQYLNNEDELFALKEYSENHDLGKDGEGSTYFITQFKTKLAMSIKQFVFEYLYRNIVYRHQYVAFRKMRGGTQSTQKFIIEDNHIRYLGNFEAGYTGPRLGRLIGFITDLGIIDDKNELTDLGVSIMDKHYSTDD